MMITTMVDLAIDLAALEHNYRQLRSLCDPQVKMLAVVKADAYGHGLLPVARKLVAAGADYLGGGSLEEGLELRRAGITLPVRWAMTWMWPCSVRTWLRPWRPRPPSKASRPGCI